MTLRLTLRLTLSLGRVCDVLCYSDVIVNFLFISLCLIDWLIFPKYPSSFFKNDELRVTVWLSRLAVIIEWLISVMVYGRLS